MGACARECDEVRASTASFEALVGSTCAFRETDIQLNRLALEINDLIQARNVTN